MRVDVTRRADTLAALASELGERAVPVALDVTDAAAVTSVNVSAAVNPDWVFVENTAKTYTFAGAGRITGNARFGKIVVAKGEGFPYW